MEVSIRMDCDFRVYLAWIKRIQSKEDILHICQKR